MFVDQDFFTNGTFSSNGTGFRQESGTLRSIAGRQYFFDFEIQQSKVARDWIFRSMDLNVWFGLIQPDFGRLDWID
jgi:hypothetical protein